MNKKDIAKKLYEIQEMGRMELNNFKVKLEGSLLDSKAKSFLHRAVDIRFKELDPVNAMVENGDMCISEIKGDNQ